MKRSYVVSSFLFAAVAAGVWLAVEWWPISPVKERLVTETVPGHVNSAMTDELPAFRARRRDRARDDGVPSVPDATSEKPSEETIALATEDEAQTEAAIVADDALAAETEGTFDPSAEDEAYWQAEATIEELQLALMEGDETQERDQAVGTMQQQLLDASLQDSRALASVIDAYRENTTTMVGAHLGDILAEIKDPEVEALAQELASSNDRMEKIAGFDLLADLKIPNETSLELAVRTLQAGRGDPDVVLSAMNAMPVLPQPQLDTEMIIGVLDGLTQHEDEGVRSASIFEIAKWAKTTVQLDSVRNALYSESDDDRISAAMALQQSAVVSDVLREELIARMVDSNELWEVRRMAADSLARFNLDDDQFALFETFKRERASVAQGG